VLGPLHLGLVSAATAVAVPLTLVNVLCLPTLACRRLGFNVRRYFVAVVKGPAIHVLPFAFILIAFRFGFKHKPLTGLAWGGPLGGVTLAVTYWLRVIPERLRRRVVRALTRRDWAVSRI